MKELVTTNERSEADVETAATKNLLTKMQVGVDSFAAPIPDEITGRPISGSDAVRNLVQRIELADQAGLDVFGVGEHHRREYLDSAPAVILAAAASRTKNIRLTSAVTVLSAADPVRVFQNFATLDLLSRGRAEMVVGRGSFTESFPLFGLAMEDYDSLFAEKLDLLLKIRDHEFVHWSGKHRPALTGQGVYPRPMQNPLPVWLGVGGTPESFARAGTLGLPLMVAIIGGEPRRFRPLVDILSRIRSACRTFARPAGKVGVHALGYVAETTKQAVEDFFPGYAKTFTKVGRERGWPPVTRAHFWMPYGASTARPWSEAPKRWRKKFFATAGRWAASRGLRSRWTWPNCRRQSSCAPLNWSAAGWRH